MKTGKYGDVRFEDQMHPEYTIAKVLAEHHPTKGMRVAMGVTCDCGFWEGRNIRRGSISDGLDLHRAEVLMIAFRMEDA
jgi:hypothetical protein